MYEVVGLVWVCPTTVSASLTFVYNFRFRIKYFSCSHYLFFADSPKIYWTNMLQKLAMLYFLCISTRTERLLPITTEHTPSPRYLKQFIVYNMGLTFFKYKICNKIWKSLKMHPSNINIEQTCYKSWQCYTFCVFQQELKLLQNQRTDSRNMSCALS
jgi:hypothetical protein